MLSNCYVQPSAVMIMEWRTQDRVQAVGKLYLWVNVRRYTATRAPLMLQTENDQIDKTGTNSRYIPWNQPQDPASQAPKFEKNAVSTAKYDTYFLTFIPLFLFEMFSRVAYLYFLIQVRFLKLIIDMLQCLRACVVPNFLPVAGFATLLHGLDCYIHSAPLQHVQMQSLS